MRIAVTGGTGVIGRAAVTSLHVAGHDVVACSRRPENQAVIAGMGADWVDANLFDVDSLTAAFEGADAVVNLATHIPSGYAALRPRAWRPNDRIRQLGSANVVTAAHRAGVRRIVQESVSLLYADGGEELITEASRLGVTAATEPAAMAEAHVQEYSCESRAGVVLRFGLIVGDDANTRFQVRGARRGRPLGLGSPDAWTHVVHTDDLGPAVLAALSAASGIYNVGAEPVRRADLVAGFAEAAGVPRAGFVGPLLRRLGGVRVEPLTRSLRVSSEHLVTQTGWKPERRCFDAGWLDVARATLGPAATAVG